MKQKIKRNIKKRLIEIEKEHNVKILYALESGSRAWGFESKDSDYDVRFIYMHRPEWYLNVFSKRDVIEYPIVDEFDFAGWDLKKALFLLSKSNPVLFEWLQSPIVYMKMESHYKLIKNVSEKYFSFISSTYHYLHMAKGNFCEYLKKDEVRIKKYFYVLRPILACMWIEQYKESPPMEFEILLNLIKKDKLIYDHIIDLLSRKRVGNELGREKRIEPLNNFIEKKLNYFEGISAEYEKQEKPKEEYLDSIFRCLLKK